MGFPSEEKAWRRERSGTQKESLPTHPTLRTDIHYQNARIQEQGRAGISGAHSLSKKANKGNYDSWQYNLWLLHRGERGGLGACDPGRGPETPDRSG